MEERERNSLEKARPVEVDLGGVKKATRKELEGLKKYLSSRKFIQTPL